VSAKVGLGGKVVGIAGSDPTLASNGTTNQLAGALSLGSLQLAADWYPDPKGGFHIQGGLGPASLSFDPTEDRGDDDAVTLDGIGGSVGVGYEGWIGRQWSLGGLLQVQWAAFDGTIDARRPVPLAAEASEDGRGVAALAPMLMLTATYH
jgi:hypothetical protein